MFHRVVFNLVGKIFSSMLSFKANCKCTTISIFQDFISRRIEISPGPAALLSSSESMIERFFSIHSSECEFRYNKFIRVILQALSKPLKTSRLANDLFGQLTTFFLVPLKFHHSLI